MISKLGTASKTIRAKIQLGTDVASNQDGVGGPDVLEVRKKWIRFEETRHVSSMIPSSRPTVPPVAIILFTGCLFCLAIIWKVGTDGRKQRAKIMITTGRVDQNMFILSGPLDYLMTVLATRRRCWKIALRHVFKWSQRSWLFQAWVGVVFTADIAIITS